MKIDMRRLGSLTPLRVMVKVVLGLAMGVAMSAGGGAQALAGQYLITNGDGAGTVLVVDEQGNITPENNPETMASGSIALAHVPFCDCVHYHGTLNGLPDPDPQGCGWGCVGVVGSPPPEPTVAGTIEVGELPFAVGVNPETNMVYVANAFDGTVSVIDGETNMVVGTIGVGRSPNGVGVNPETNMIYVANSVSDTVSVIDGETNMVVDTIGVGEFPRGVGVNPETNMVYVANAFDGTVSVIDGETHAETTIELGESPSGVGVNPITSMVYVTDARLNNITVIEDR